MGNALEQPNERDVSDHEPVTEVPLKEKSAVQRKLLFIFLQAAYEKKVKSEDKTELESRWIGEHARDFNRIVCLEHPDLVMRAAQNDDAALSEIDALLKSSADDRKAEKQN